MEIRAAAAAHMPAVRRIAEAYGNLHDWRVRPDYLDHARAAGRFLVAGRDDGVAGFATVYEREGVAHLGDLFVDPARRGEGIGSALLDAAWGTARERVTFASADDRALALYLRHGMLAVTPAIHVAGTAAAASSVAAEPAGAEALTALDAHVCGRARPQEHAFLDAHPATTGYRVGDDGYGWVRREAETAHVGPAGCLPTGDVVAVVRALCRVALEDCAAVQLMVPGWNPALRDLLESGFRKVDQDILMASRLDLLDAARYVPSMDLG